MVERVGTCWDKFSTVESQFAVDPSPFRLEDCVEDEGLGRRLARVDREMTPGQVVLIDLSHLSRARPNARNSILTPKAWRGFLRRRVHDRLQEVFWTFQIEVEDSEGIGAREGAVAAALVSEVDGPASLDETSVPYDPR